MTTDSETETLENFEIMSVGIGNIAQTQSDSGDYD